MVNGYNIQRVTSQCCDESKKKKKPYFLKTSVSTAAIKAGQCRTGRTHKSTTFKAKSKAKGMKPNNKTPSYI